MTDTIYIDKLMHWRAANWMKFDHNISNAILRIRYDQLVIYANNKILESLNLHGKIKGFYKEDVLILILNSTGSEVRKIKFRIKSNVSECLQALSQHFPVVNHGCMQGSVISSRYKNVEEVLKCAMETMDGKDNSSMELPSNYTNFVKFCLLDPTFPQVVLETQNIISKF